MLRFLPIALVLVLAACAEDPLRAAERALEEGRAQEAYATARDLTRQEGGSGSVEPWLVLARASLVTIMPTAPRATKASEKR